MPGRLRSRLLAFMSDKVGQEFGVVDIPGLFEGSGVRAKG
jgi:hypothetical protein